jgi:hypothetical protein
MGERVLIIRDLVPAFAAMSFNSAEPIQTAMKVMIVLKLLF